MRSHFPCVQVHSLDKQLRNAPQGYGHLSLAGHPLGASAHTVSTWRPQPSGRERVAEWFVGGAPELTAPSYVAHPRQQPCGEREGGAKGRVVNKMCAITEPGGTIELRTMCAVQHSDPCALCLVDVSLSGSGSMCAADLEHWDTAALQSCDILE